jgi:hypothetical protein
MKNYTSNLSTLNHTEQEGRISAHGIAIAILSAIACQMTLYTMMGVTIFDIPLMFTILIWCIFGGFVGLLMDHMGV